MSCSPRSKDDTPKTSSIQLCSGRTPTEQSHVSRRPSCRQLQKVPFKVTVEHSSVAPENPEFYLRPCCQKVNLAFTLANFPNFYLVTSWRSHKSTPGSMYNLTSHLTYLKRLHIEYIIHTHHKTLEKKNPTIRGNGSPITSHQTWQRDMFRTSTKLPNTHNSYNPIYHIQVLFCKSYLFICYFIFYVLIYFISY